MSIFALFGGAIAPEAGPALAEIQKRTAAQFKGGTGKIELVKAMSAGDLLVLVLVETNQVKFDGFDTPRPWTLRTTQVFRREGDHWLRLHRHADPLTKRRTLPETLALY
jgi:ketosteroid isomerase-like protein